MEHQRAVVGCVVLRPAQAFDVHLELDRSFVEPCEISIAKLALLTLCNLTRHADRGLADRLTDVARTGMQHDPYGARLIEAQLDEVVTTTERSELLEGPRRVVLTDHIEDLELTEALVELLAGLRELRTAYTIAHRVDCYVMRREANRHTHFDTRAQGSQRVRQVVCRDRRTHCRHAATDVHADRARDDRGLRRKDRSNRCTLAKMHVR